MGTPRTIISGHKVNFSPGRDAAKETNAPKNTSTPPDPTRYTDFWTNVNSDIDCLKNIGRRVADIPITANMVKSNSLPTSLTEIECP